MRHLHALTSERPALAATLLTKAQSISNAMGIIRVGQEALSLVQQFFNVFSRGD